MDLTISDFEPLLTAATIQGRIAELGAQISKDFPDGVVAVGVLKGSFIFLADLVRHLPLGTTCDFLRTSSYEGVHSSGKVRLEFDLTQPVEGQDVLIVEDIIDTGLTANFLIQALSVRSPRSLSICTLLDKPARRRPEIKVPIQYCGFSIEDRFVIGYGLDFDGRWRNIPEVLALKPHAAKALEEA